MLRWVVNLMHELHHPPAPSYIGMKAQDITKDVLERHENPGRAFRNVSLLMGGLVLLGVVGVIMLLSEGFDDRNTWGYHAVIFAYIFTVAQSAVLISIALRMVKSHWRRPLARISEMFAAVGLFNFLLMIPLLWVLPPTDGRRSIWFGAPGHSPHFWDTLGMGLLVVCGLALLYFASLPDMAAIRDSDSSSRKNFYRRMSMNWHGTPHQWKVLRAGISVLGGFYFLLLIFMHMMIGVDFSMSLIPGWKDAIFPAYHAISGIQSAIALVLVTMFILRWRTGMREYISVHQFWGLSKILLATCLLWFYHWWSSFFTYWYGRTPAELAVLKFLMFETYKVPFFLAWSMCFLLPFLILMWNIIRKTTWVPTLAGCVILVGTFFNVVHWYVAAFSIVDPSAHVLESAPAVNLPGLADVFVIVGGIAGAILTYMLATRIFPIISLWEIKEGVMLQKVRRFMKTEVYSVGKPE